MNINIRKFKKSDIPNKVKWINAPENNTFLHYDIPLEIKKTEEWFDNNKNRIDRYDAIIEVDNTPVGLIGLLCIDEKNKKAEYYITIGEHNFRGKGVAVAASKLLLDYAFKELSLNRVYLYVEKNNIAAIKSYERIGFKKEGTIINDLFSKGRFVDRYIYGITKADYIGYYHTPINKIDNIEDNNLFIKREDFIPFSFGGNKARKAQLFFKEIDKNSYDCVVTYGSSSSNHCRIISNMAYARDMPCYIISPEENSEITYNSKLMNLFNAKILTCPLSNVHETIENTLSELKEHGYKPYFIQGGGHEIIGTQAYVDCYEEICNYENEHNLNFDYIFHASGTGTTQAGLVCGQLINHHLNRTIIGISIARKNPRGRNIVLESIKDYLCKYKIFVSNDIIEKSTIFIDEYTGDGYGTSSSKINQTIQNTIKQLGIPLDFTYTGKAFYGMIDFIKKNHIHNKNILFIHTGGTPLFFDYLNKPKWGEIL